MIVLDVDGVLADTPGAVEARGRPHDDAPADWWASIPLYPWADELVTGLRGLGRVVVATALDPRLHEAYAGRCRWIVERLGTCDLLIGPPKALLARRGRVLVDDSRETCAAFRAGGGGAVEFPRTWLGEVVDVADVVAAAAALLREGAP